MHWDTVMIAALSAFPARLMIGVNGWVARWRALRKP
jgi:hypothetical protein